LGGGLFGFWVLLIVIGVFVVVFVFFFFYLFIYFRVDIPFLLFVL